MNECEILVKFYKPPDMGKLLFLQLNALGELMDEPWGGCVNKDGFYLDAKGNPTKRRAFIPKPNGEIIYLKR